MKWNDIGYAYPGALQHAARPHIIFNLALPRPPPSRPRLVPQTAPCPELRSTTPDLRNSIPDLDIRSMSYVRYDSSLIQEFAQKMYSQANAAVIFYTLLGLIACGRHLRARPSNGIPHSFIGGGILFGGILGYLVTQPNPAPSLSACKPNWRPAR